MYWNLNAQVPVIFLIKTSCGIHSGKTLSAPGGKTHGFLDNSLRQQVWVNYYNSLTSKKAIWE